MECYIWLLGIGLGGPDVAALLHVTIHDFVPGPQTRPNAHPRDPSKAVLQTVILWHKAFNAASAQYVDYKGPAGRLGCVGGYTQTA